MTLHHFTRHRVICIVMGAGVAVAIALLAYNPWLHARYAAWELKAFDAKQQWIPASTILQSSKIVNIDIDDNSIDVIGRWPWNRSVHGILVETLKELGARSTLFDVEFYQAQLPQYDQLLVDRKIASYRPDSDIEYKFMYGSHVAGTYSRLESYWGPLVGKTVDPETQEKYFALLNQLAAESGTEFKHQLYAQISSIVDVLQNHDARFASGIERSGNVILPMHFILDVPPFPKLFHEAVPGSSSIPRIELFRQLLDGRRDITDEDLAERLGISKETVQLHRMPLVKHLYIDSRPEILAIIRDVIRANPSASASGIIHDVNARVHLLPGHSPDEPDYMDIDNFRDALISARELAIYEIIEECVDQQPEIPLNDMIATAFPGITDFQEQIIKEIHYAYDRVRAARYIREHAAMRLTEHDDITPLQIGIEPALFEYLIHSHLNGFVTIPIDPDGILRRVPVLGKLREDGQYYPQMAFRATLDLLGVDPDKGVEFVPGKRIVIHDAKFPDGTVRSFEIPVDNSCNMLVNWAGSRSRDVLAWKNMFTHVSYATIYNMGLRIEEMENSFVDSSVALWRSIVKQREYGDDTTEYQIYKGMAFSPLIADLRQVLLDERMKTEHDAKDALRAYLVTKPRFEAIRTLLNDYLTAANAYIESLPPRMRQKNAEFINQLTYNKNRALENLDSCEARLSLLRPFIEGNLCIVGSAHTGSTDLRATPTHHALPGVLLHSNVMNMMLNPDLFFRYASAWVNVLSQLLIVLALSFFVSEIGPFKGILLTSLTTVGIFAAHTYAMAHASLLIDTLAPCAGCGMAFLSITSYRFLTEGKKSRQIKASFEKFVSKDYVNELLKNPDKLRLGGETRNMTAHFSDIRGFSGFSEILTPDKLVHVLNIYLTRMTDIIQQHRGTLDKYEGDAVIAFFNAPLDDADHCEHAIEAGLAELAALPEINEYLHKEGTLPPHVNIQCRVGLNSGPMVVGNMGSEKFFNYTMMGDNVNLASRLEGGNKPFGTYYMVGSKTYEGAKDKFVFRRLAKLVVVGRKSAEPVYQPFGRPHVVNERTQAMIQRFHDGLDLFNARQWEKAKAVFQSGLDEFQDPPCKLYIHLCDEYAERELADTWAGEIELSEK